MIDAHFARENKDLIDRLRTKQLSPFDLIPHADLREKLVELVLGEPPRSADGMSSMLLNELRQKLVRTSVDEVKVVVFGGGTGLSNIIGGDCRQEGWARRPFEGLKQLFPATKAVVCVTDDGGSTGELLKDLPLFALGDIRHVMLSSIQQKLLKARYDLTGEESLCLMEDLARLFNYRFVSEPGSYRDLLDGCGVDLLRLPPAIRAFFERTLSFCFSDEQLRRTLKRPHCLGNLVLCAALYPAVPSADRFPEGAGSSEEADEGITRALSECAYILGAAEEAVLPCTATPAQLRFSYTDGVQVTGEDKSSVAARGFPIEHVAVDFCGRPRVSRRLLSSVRTADILIMAPGSLYSSIIPVMQVPGIADAVRENSRALKLLIANLWVQEGETDRSIADPDRKFHVSDMIKAYDRNLPGGIRGLCSQILCMSLQDVPGTVLQNYAVEGKNPIYLDRDILRKQGFDVIECGFYSRRAMLERQVIQHDPNVVAQTVKTLYLAGSLNESGQRVTESARQLEGRENGLRSRLVPLPSSRYARIRDLLASVPVIVDRQESSSLDADTLRLLLGEIIWRHHDIPITHLQNIHGIHSIRDEDWRRDQRWDNVYSFYDPADGFVNIRRDRTTNAKNLEIALLIAIGQALLGDYAETKSMEVIRHGGKTVGRVFHLHLREAAARTCYFTRSELTEYLELARMVSQGPLHFTRIINGPEGFTPPGLLMGLMYAWYLDNRFASHIEYKMSILKVRQTQLIPEQRKTRERRERLIAFFRERVFGKGFELL